MILVTMLVVRASGVIVVLTALYLQIPETRPKYQVKLVLMRTAVMNNSSVVPKANASLRGGSVTTTKIARMERTNTTVLLLSVMLVNFLVSATNSTTPTVFQAITDVIKNKIVMMVLMKRVATIVRAKMTTSSAETGFVYQRKRAAMGTLTVGTKRTKKGAKERVATFLNSDVPTGKNALQNFRNATIAKNALTDLMRAIAIFLHVIVVNSDVKIIAVSPPDGTVMATKIVRMVQMKQIVLPLHAQKTNLCVPKAVQMLLQNA